jgi:hypothetical protein
MPSPKTLLFQAIETRLREEVANLGAFELWREQPDNEAKEDPLEFPAVFLEFAELDYSSQGSNIQAANVKVALHIVYEDMDMKSLAFLEFVEEVQFALQGLQGADNLFTMLERESEKQVVRRDNLVEWVIEYVTRLQDETTARTARLVLTANPLTLELIGDPEAPRLLP